MSRSFTVQIQYDDKEGDFYFPIPEEMLPLIADLGWSVNDQLEWIDNENGSFTIKKKEQE